jgi:hypothetical protein
MPRRQSKRSVTSARSSKSVRPKGWLSRLLSGASDAGIGTDRNYGMEKLETRRLLTTFTSFGANETGTHGDFIFYTGQAQVAVLSFYDVDFEAIAARVDPTTGNVSLVDPIAAHVVEPTVGANIYKIYVTDSAADSYISISTLSHFPSPIDPGVVPTPYTGTIPGLVVRNAQTGLPYVAAMPGGTGGILLGAVYLLPTAITDVPITSIPLATNYGLQPAPVGGALTPGIEVAPINSVTGEQNDFGEFFVGGTVTGSVEFGANLGEFYAGAVLTGDLLGDPAAPQTSPTSARTDPDNFYVAGDLRNFLTAGPVGTDNTGGAGSPNYVTSFDLSVGGKIGQIHIGGALAGTVEAGNSPYISGQTPYPAGSTSQIQGNYAPQTEVEADPAGNPDLTFTGAVQEANNPYDPIDPADTVFPPPTLPPSLDSAEFSNNTLAGAQLLGSVPETNQLTGLPEKDAAGNVIYEANVDGTIDDSGGAADSADTYAVPFLAGTTFQVQLYITNPAEAALAASSVGELEVVDPDGRIIASDSRSVDSPLQITTDRPGLYRFIVMSYNKYGVVTTAAFDYNLSISNTGNLGIGGIRVDGNYDDIGVDSAIIVGNGDLGAIQVGATYASTTSGPTPVSTNATAPVYASTSILVADGDLRDLTATSIGFLSPDGPADAPILSVPNGNVGLIQATGNLLYIESQFDPNQLDLPTPVYKTDDAYATAIGGSIQVIDAATLLETQIATNAGIGTIRAGSMSTATPDYIDVNADNKGTDGIIDLVDVSGQFGFLGSGGPNFVTNTGGYVRYLNVGGPVFLPAAYGGLQDSTITYPAGVTTPFTDDTGAVINMTADGPETVTTINNSNGTTSTETTGPQVSLLAYPVLDKSGLIPISITSSGGLTLSGTGADGAGSQVDVANISITGIGRPITIETNNSSTGVVTNVTDPYNNSMIVQTVPSNGSAGIINGAVTDPTDEFLSITGPATFNVLNTTAYDTVSGNSPVEVQNTTEGEMVNLFTLPQLPNTSPVGIGSIDVGGNLGFSTPQATAAAVLPRAEIQDGNTYPFVQQHTGVVIGTGFVISDTSPTSAGTAGDVVSILVGGAAGNIEAGGTIQSLIVNSAQSMSGNPASAIPGQFDGIVGPVLATRLLYVDVGQGLAPTGSGLVGFSGLYGTGKIGLVNNAGNPNGDIRGNIVSAEDLVDTETVPIGIDAVSLVNGSIIGSTITTIADAPGQIPQFVESSDVAPNGIVIQTNATGLAPVLPGQTPYVYDIGPITVSGDGGIIGSQISAGSMASITVTNGGFGILNDYIDGQTSGIIGSISASGYGIRDTIVNGIGDLGPVTATGNGSLIPVTNYPVDVRPSDIPDSTDPFFGIYPDSQIDINAILGTSALSPNIPGRTDTGVIEDDIFNGLDNFTGLSAQKARTALPEVTTNTAPTPDVLNVPTLASVFSDSISFGGEVGYVKIYQETDGLQITAGKLGSLALSSNVNRIGISTAGNIGTLVIHGNLGQYVTDPTTGNLVPDSYINAGGINGTITSLKVLGNLNANVYATGEIGTITVTGDMLGGIIAYGKGNGYALANLHVYGGIRDGSLVLNGNVGSIIVNGTLGTSTGSLSIEGSANLIEVGSNRAPGSQLALALSVGGNIKSLLVYGTITGSVRTGLNLNSLKVTNTGPTANAITGNITVGGKLGTAKIANGNVTSNIVVTNSVSSFTIVNGDLNAGATIQSLLSAISIFKIQGGSMYGDYGSLLATNGTNESVDISGNLGDGVNPAQIVANSGVTFRIRGNVTGTGSVSLGSYLNLLQVDGSILTGATISAHPIKKQKIAGTDSGTVIAV